MKMAIAVVVFFLSMQAHAEDCSLLSYSDMRAKVSSFNNHFEPGSSRFRQAGQLNRCLVQLLDWTPDESDPFDVRYDYEGFGTSIDFTALAHLAATVSNLGLYSSAVAIHEWALQIAEDLNPSLRILAVSRLAVTLLDAGDSQRAARLLNQYSDRLADTSPLATAVFLDSRGRLLGYLGKWKAAFEAHDNAVKVYQTATEILPMALAEFINNRGIASYELSHGRDALNDLSQARDLRRIVHGDLHPSLAESNHNLSKIRALTGDLSEAIRLQQLSIDVWHQVLPDDHPALINAYNDLGWIESETGDHKAAVSHINRACTLANKHFGANHVTSATCLHNRGYQHRLLGAFGDALDDLETALVLRQQQFPTPHPRIANTLENLGLIYGALGEVEKQTAFLVQAYEQRLAVFGQQHLDVALSLNNIGYSHTMQNRLDKARQALTESLDIRQALLADGHRDIALTQSNLAYVMVQQDDLLEARALYQEAGENYAAQPMVASDKLAYVFSGLGEIATREGQYDDAEQHYLHALALVSDSDTPRFPLLTAHVAAGLAKVLANVDDINGAIWFMKSAVNLISRSHRSVPQDLQMTYLKSNEELFRLLARWLVEAGRIGEASEVMDLMDIYQNDVRLRATSDPDAAQMDLNAGERRVSGKIARLLDQLRKSLGRDRSIHKIESSGISEITKDLYNERFKKKMNISGCNVTSPAVLSNYQTLDKPIVEKGEVLIRYLVFDDQLQTIVMTGVGYYTCDTQVPRADISTMVAKFRDSIESAKHRSTDRGLHQLYKLLISPIDKLFSTTDRLVFDADSSLRFVPFHGLYDGEQYLIERFAITMRTENSIKTQAYSQKPFLAGFGVSATHRFGRALPAVRDELNSIIKEGDQDEGYIEGEVYLDAAFTEEQYLDALNRRIPYLHVTGHYEIQPGDLMRSYFLSGNDSVLYTHTLIGTKPMSLGNVKLMVLPSCDTAVSPALIEKVGIHQVDVERSFEGESLAGAVQRSGASTVLASLWKVADQSTAALMKSFYRHVVEGKTVVRALQLARLDLLSGEVSCSSCGQDWRRPYYWAGITQYGAP